MGGAAVAAKKSGACASGRPAVYHHAGGVAAPGPGGKSPVACGTTTGFAGAESHIVATGDGAVVFAPAVVPQGLAGIGVAPVDAYSSTQSNASPAGIAITKDNGAHWAFVPPYGLTWNPTDHGDYADPVTGRLFFEDYGPIPEAPSLGAEQEGPAHIMWSADDGAHWHHTAIDTLFLPENPRFASAPAPAGQPQPQGYPDVVYFCANTNVGFVSPVIGGRVCFTSLDGGSTFQQAGILFTGAAPQHGECGQQGESYSAIDGYYPQPARDGSLYVMVACGGSTYLAHSTDEAKTFPIVHRADGTPVTLPVPVSSGGTDALATPDLRIGPDDTMYLAYQDTVAGRTALMLRVSQDHGLTWTAPLDVLAPGVTDVLKWSVAQRGAEVAFAYLGHGAGQTTWDGYVTETTNAADAVIGGTPLFVSGSVNDPAQPLLYSDNVQGAGYLELPAGANVPFPPPFDIQMLGNDFIGATIAPDGTPWGSFTQDCGPSADSPGCQQTKDQTRGFAGFLTRLP